ncbi:hypothetical protein [Streptomyces sp. NBC_00370]|uniref:hypothetical protein n=1 Tax=Streptomyces sp. NBC_00370 TaxID=2975728 RepID=UPI003FA7DB64
MSEIKSVDCKLVTIEPETLRTDATQTFVRQETVLVTVETADGLRGTGYSYTIGTGGSSVLALLRDHLAATLIGQDARNVEAVWARMLAATRATAGGVSAVGADRRARERRNEAVRRTGTVRLGR